MVEVRVVNPPPLGKPSGYSHGIVSGGFVFVSGQVGARPDEKGRLKMVSEDFAKQFDQALANVLLVVEAAGGTAATVVEMTVFVTDVGVYAGARTALAPLWKKRMGSHFPAMTLVGVSGLFEHGSRVEIRAVARVPREAA